MQDLSAIDIEGIEENPMEAAARKQKKKEAPVIVDGDPKKIVKVRCVTENGPFDSEGNRLEYWKDYQLSNADAALLESKKFVVITQK